MRLDELATFAAVAAVAQAFLIPPEISSKDVDISNAIPTTDLMKSLEFAVNVQCGECDIPAYDSTGRGVTIHTADSSLGLNITVSNDNALLFNGIQLYPVVSLPADPITATQTLEVDGESIIVREGVLGFMISIMESDPQSQSDNFHVLSVQFQIREFAGKTLNRLDSVDITLIKTSDGELMIQNIATSPTFAHRPATGPGGSHKKPCTTLLCKLKSIIGGNKKGGCHKGADGHKRKGNKHHNGSEEHLRPHGDRPHGHPGHMRHGHHGGLRKIVKNIILYTFASLFLIAASFTAGLLGYAIGQAISYVWMRYYRGGQRGSYAQIEQVETTDLKEEETDSRGSPPVYEDVIEDEKTSSS